MSADLGFLSILLIAVALGMDAFSLFIGVGMQGVDSYRTGQLTLTVGILHIILPLLGIFIGQTLGAVAGEFASYLGAILLIVLGAKMIYNEFTEDEEESTGVSNQSNSTWQFVILPISVSLDSLSIGFSLGTFGVQKLLFITGTFGVVAAIMTLAGLVLGERIGHAIDKTDLVGGAILIILGLKMLFA